MRVAVGRPVALTHTFEGDSELPLDVGAVTITFTRSGATAPTLTVPAVKSGTTYTYTAVGLLQGIYLVSWVGTGYTDTTLLEIIGRDLFTVAHLRDSHPNLTAAAYSRDKVVAVRDLVLQEFELVTGRSFVPRTVRVPWLSGDALPRMDVASVKVYDNSSTLIDGGIVEYVGEEALGPYAFLPSLTYPEAMYSVELDYGFRNVPEDIRKAALLRTKSILFEPNSGLPDRATSFQPTEGGTYILATAGRRGSTTGIPDVDAALARYTHTIADSIGGFW